MVRILPKIKWNRGNITQRQWRITDCHYTSPLGSDVISLKRDAYLKENTIMGLNWSILMIHAVGIESISAVGYGHLLSKWANKAQLNYVNLFYSICRNAASISHLLLTLWGFLIRPGCLMLTSGHFAMCQLACFGAWQFDCAVESSAMVITEPVTTY